MADADQYDELLKGVEAAVRTLHEKIAYERAEARQAARGFTQNPGLLSSEDSAVAASVLPALDAGRRAEYHVQRAYALRDALDALVASLPAEIQSHLSMLDDKRA